MISNHDNKFSLALYNIEAELRDLQKHPRRLFDLVRKKLNFSEEQYALTMQKQREYIMTRSLEKVMRAIRKKNLKWKDNIYGNDEQTNLDADDNQSEESGQDF